MSSSSRTTSSWRSSGAIVAATVAEVERLLAADDENGLVELLSLGALSLLIESVRSAFMTGARFEMAAIVLPRADRELNGRKEFDVNRAEASSWLAQQVTDTRNTTTDNVREAMDLEGVDADDRKQVFRDVRTMEQEALRTMADSQE